MDLVYFDLLLQIPYGFRLIQHYFVCLSIWNYNRER